MSKVSEIITEQIISKLREGVVPWHKPWGTNIPVNYITQKPYKGVNRWLLDGGEYVTFKQVQDMKSKIRKGAKSRIVVFYKPLSIGSEDEDEELQDKFILRYYKVFNIKDCEGIVSRMDNKKKLSDEFRVERCENVIKNYCKNGGPKFVGFDTEHSYYSIKTDTVNLPPFQQFMGAEEYYSTAFHELVHSTGHISRLNRFKSAEDKRAYAREELVAEIGAAILCGLMGIDTITLDNSTSYINSWLRALQNDTNCILYASAKAEKAAEFIAPHLLQE